MTIIAAALALAITKGPIIDGEELGPLLLWPGRERYAAQWTIGQFDGAQWHDQDGWVFKPTQWSALPEVPE